MIKIISATILLSFSIVLCAYYKEPKPSKASIPVLDGLHFTDFRVTKLNAKEVDLLAVTDNNGIEQKTEIVCTVGDSSLLFTILVLPNDRNVILRYKSSIKIK